MSRLKKWLTYDREAERSSADNPVGPLDDSQRRGALPLLTLAFGWGFLVTGLFIGGSGSHPGGGLTGLGTSPSKITRSSFISGSAGGTAVTKASVYGCKGFLSKVLSITGTR